MVQGLLNEKCDLTYLSWTRTRHSSGTAGSFLKAQSEISGKKTYYKLSNFDSGRGVWGHECVNEIIVDRLLTILGIDHLQYQLLKADIIIERKPYTTYLNASVDFKKPGEAKLALDAFYELDRLNDESPLEFVFRHGWEDYISKMLIVDFLILNRDRHGANIEVLRDREKQTFRLAPLFDHGLSLLFNCLSKEAVDSFDVLQDRMTNTFIGSRSTWENLKLIQDVKDLKINDLKEKDRETILDGLDGVLPKYLLDKIWEMIWKRWCKYEDFRNSR